MELYFCRHGQTQWNVERRFQGREGDSPLLPKSYEEIQLLGQRLKNIPFSQVYCSTSKRARKTAEGIMAVSLYPQPIIYTDCLQEIGLGTLEGTLIEEAKENYCKELEALRYNPNQYNPKAFGGESYQAMLNRISHVVFQAIEKENQGPILFVGHGASFTGSIQYLAGKPLSQLREMGGLDNSSLSVLEVELPNIQIPYNLKLWNDVSHLWN